MKGIRMRRALIPAACTSLLFALALAGCGPQRPPAPREALESPAYVKAVAYLQTQSRSPDPIVRANCIEALQLSRDPRVTGIIEQGLRDEQWVVRFAAAMAAGKRKARVTLPALETMAGNDPNGSVRVAAIYALKRMDRPQRMSDLAATLGAQDPSVRANTAFVLGLLGDASAVPLLDAHRNDADVRVRTEVTSALARLGDPVAQQVVVGWAVNRFAEDQYAAMTVCGDLPPNVAESPLLLGLDPVPPKLSADADPAVVRDLTTRRQLVAARSLAKLRNGTGAKIALDNLQNANPNLRSLALMALGDMLTFAQVPGIEPYLEDPDEGVRRAAAAAILNVFEHNGPYSG
jgi:HEAT repeat protein